MQTHYVIIYANINVLAGDRIAVGVLFIKDNNYIFYKFAWRKLKNAQKLFASEAFELIISYLHDIQDSACVPKNKDLVAYFDHISVQCNNLITFNKPTPINIENTDENLRKFAETYINTPQ